MVFEGEFPLFQPFELNWPVRTFFLDEDDLGVQIAVFVFKRVNQRLESFDIEIHAPLARLVADGGIIAKSERDGELA